MIVWRYLVLYDGECGLCDRLVQWLLIGTALLFLGFFLLVPLLLVFSKALAEGVQGIRGLRCAMPETNLLFVDVDLPMGAVAFAAACKAEGVLCNAEGGKARVRVVTHLALVDG